MNFADASQGPITVFVGGKPVAIPRFTRRDWKAWASLEDAKRLEKAVEGLSPEDRFKYVAYYTVPPTSPREMRSNLTTYDGQEYIIRSSLKKVGPEWTDERVDQFLEGNDEESIELLAFQLASVAPSVPPVSKPAGGQGKQPAEGEQRQGPTETAARRTGSASGSNT